MLGDMIRGTLYTVRQQRDCMAFVSWFVDLWAVILFKLNCGVFPM